MIDRVLDHHILSVRYSFYVAAEIATLLKAFQDGLVNLVLLDFQKNKKANSRERVITFNKNLDESIKAFTSKLDLFLAKQILVINEKEKSFLEKNFGIPEGETKQSIVTATVMSVPHYQASRLLIQNMQMESSSVYNASMTYGEREFVLIDRFRGTRPFNFKDNIFTVFKNRFNAFSRTLVLEQIAKTRLHFYSAISKDFVSFSNISPFGSTGLPNLYSYKGYELIVGKDQYKGPLETYGSTKTPIPFVGTKYFNAVTLNNWFKNKPENYQRRILGDKKLKLFKKGGFARGQIFDFRNSNFSYFSL